jgi:hypothetical protein
MQTGAGRWSLGSPGRTATPRTPWRYAARPIVRSSSGRRAWGPTYPGALSLRAIGRATRRSASLVGRRITAPGGSSAATTTRAAPRRDSIRWGPIWAGLITALTVFLLLQLLAIGLGLIDIGPGADGGGWVSAIIGLIAFFIGGSVAGMTSAMRGEATGLLNGFLVWALGTVLILLLSALGLGQIFGALGHVVGQLGVLQNLQGANVPDINPARIAQAVRSGAIGAFFGLLLSALASMLGGFLGGRSSDPLGRMARE